MFPRSHFSFACVGLCAPSRSSKMDASSLAAAALAVAMEDSRTAAVRELMLDRERAAMANEDARSYMAQRHFTHSQMILGPDNAGPQTTWRAAFLAKANDRDRLRGVMRASLMHMREGNARLARAVIAWTVGEPDDEDVGEEPEGEDALVEDFTERARTRSPRR